MAVTLTNSLLIIIVAELALLVVLTWKRPSISFDPTPQQHQFEFAMTNYCTWTYENGKWRVTKDRCLPGFHCGDPPLRPGGYPNESVNKPATRIG